MNFWSNPSGNPVYDVIEKPFFRIVVAGESLKLTLIQLTNRRYNFNFQQLRVQCYYEQHYVLLMLRIMDSIIIKSIKT